MLGVLKDETSIVGGAKARRHFVFRGLGGGLTDELQAVLLKSFKGNCEFPSVIEAPIYKDDTFVG